MPGSRVAEWSASFKFLFFDRSCNRRLPSRRLVITMYLYPGLIKTALDGQFLSYALRTNHLYTRAYGAIPRVAKPSFWQSLIPKPLRHTQQPTNSAPVRRTSPSKPWNPATFFIITFLIIGSNSINLLAVRKDALSFSRQADARIATLKEAIERVQRGEDVDVKRLLGTGDPTAEQEWEEVLKELKQERPPASKKNKKEPATMSENRVDNTQKAAFEKEEDWTKPREDGQTIKKVDFY